MIRSHWMTSASAAKAYYKAADYYATCEGEWLGTAAPMLGLTGAATAEQFGMLADNINPLTGKSLTSRNVENRRVGIDLTFNASKSVTLARELANLVGDDSIEKAHREAVSYTVGLLEKDMQARVRAGGRNENRTTGNLVAYRVTHRDTRINAEDQMPDPQLHDHVFVFNATYDAVEDKWKAAELGQIKHDLPFYEAAFHNRLAGNLQELGYGVERRGRAFEVSGISRELIEKFSRRTKYINEVAEKLGITNGESKSKLGAKTRLGKVKETNDDLTSYYVSRLTDDEKDVMKNLIGKESAVNSPEQAVRYAFGHEFERSSVVEEKQLYKTALRYGVGGGSLEQVLNEARNQGLLVRDGQATTKAVLAEERRIIDFARDGKGTRKPLGNKKGDTSGLSRQQASAAKHIWKSSDRVMLIRGAAGTGKTHTMKAIAAGIDKPITFLAPSADASRGVLREEGFADADTVSRFLGDEEFQAGAKNGVIWIDEAGLLGMKQAREVMDVAEKLNARVILQGDEKQHGSVPRGALLRVVQEFAHLPVAELTDIRRQSGDYRQAIKMLSEGKAVKGFDALNDMGWVKQADHDELVDDYMSEVDSGKEVMAIAPTHAEGQAITSKIRDQLKERGKLSDEREINVLNPLHWTDAEKEDVQQYQGGEVFQFHRNGGTFKAGQRVDAADFRTGDKLGKASTFSLYSREAMPLAVGDTIRLTANGKTKSGKRINNGSQYQVTGFTKDGDIEIGKVGVLDKDFGHLSHGYVSTSHASQGKTVPKVLIAMGAGSGQAISSEQFYVSASRGRHQATIYSDMPVEDLRQAVARGDNRKSASELIPENHGWKWHWMKKIKNRLRSRFAGGNEGDAKQRDKHEQVQRAV